jgi:predicted flap endonuclease-1-like 5' DNA nuclease
VAGAASAHASNYALEEIPQAIPAPDAAKLKAAGIPTTFALLEKASEPKDRKRLAKTTKINEKQLESWVQMADVLRVRGIGPDVARLLAAVGVLTVAQLKSSNANELNDEIAKVNSKQHLSENPPSLEHLSAWIAQAQTLPIVLH